TCPPRAEAKPDRLYTPPQAIFAVSVAVAKRRLEDPSGDRAGDGRAVQVPAVAAPRSGQPETGVVSGVPHARSRAGGADEGAVRGLLPASSRAQADGRGVRRRPPAARGPQGRPAVGAVPRRR